MKSFRRRIESLFPKKDGAPESVSPELLMGLSAREEVQNVTAAPVKKSAPVIYGDLAVCQALRIRRRVIAAARTNAARGSDWDCIDLQAGMTKAWVEKKALELHVVPDFVKLVPIVHPTGIVSAKLIGVWPNTQRVTAEIVATGERKIVWVKDSTLMHLNEIFDCVESGNEFYWRADINGMTY